MDWPLSKAEQAAKQFVLNLLLRECQTLPSDNGIIDDETNLPSWYDEDKFKRGQKYFGDNRLGIMVSNMLGMFSLISEPNGAKLLDKTGKSSRAETAKKRYVSTTVHMISWYQCDLTPGSSSWESLKRVRKMHTMASKLAKHNNLNVITQTAMSMTQFGFMGFALVRPHLLAIKHDNDEDREAFVHFWAVIGHMLGIKDEFNVCLHSLEVVETICRILIRYAFIPFLQFETPTFEKLGTAFVEGMSAFIPFMTFQSRLFLVRRIAGVPGFQYNVDMSKEILQRQIFTKDELQMIVEGFQMVPGHEYRRHLVFDEKIRLLNIRRMKKNPQTFRVASDFDQNPSKSTNGIDAYVDDDVSNIDYKKHLMAFLELQHPKELQIIDVDEQCIAMYQNDWKFHELGKRDQWRVNMVLGRIKQLEKPWTKYLRDSAVSINIYRMKRFVKNAS